ncbi:hypothetical protein MMC26_007521 [Xylographa opegraphella]|nr:hypothetical protein [Xylographa opegraphella]
MNSTRTSRAVYSNAEFKSLQLHSHESHGASTRLGTLRFNNGTHIETPHYIATTSRGAVPHLSQDTMRDNTGIKGVYVALEDYLERLPLPPPVYSVPCPAHDSPLRRFIALQKDALLVLGPRRYPPIHTPGSNSYMSLSILTSVGFRNMEVSDYIHAAKTLRPDVVIGCADVVYGEARAKLGLKRKEKMGERTLAWLKALLTEIQDEQGSKSTRISIWAPILPIEGEMQRELLDYLEVTAVLGDVSGLVLYDISGIDDISASLISLPRLALTEPKGPYRVLEEISLGVDLFSLPFLNAATDAGVAFTFRFPVLPNGKGEQPKTALGCDLWSSKFATELAPLEASCECYTCVHHHCAFIQHLLSAKEMLGWVLLQIHNHAMADAFFDGIRTSIAKGTFVDDCDVFGQTYEMDFPNGTGTGPRIRGYQFQPSGMTLKKTNPSAYKKLYEPESLSDNFAAEESLISPSVNAKDLEDMGFAKLW